MDRLALATAFGAELPAWVADELADVPDVLATAEDRMKVVHRLADRNHREDTGGPFAALVVESGTGRVVSAGVNVVLASGLSSTHAEVVALSLAQVRLGTWNLGADGRPDLELVVNWRPCAMCYGATLWSGVRGLVIAGDGPELEALTGFDEGPVRDDWLDQLTQRGIAVTCDVLRDEALAVFRSYGARDDALVYNARGGTGR
ncbi:nucleoside deaminase [Yinghuangia soli]|uniref:Nucleoside deaminase n=1 Tax=Yinghuangia soli TaxID=2908204 RepID=A0AA41Q3V3_9ACTN|nr:nucleoside deaminase [Yinghuangia soli]MCF2531049.1 nucleoside deaminase [Yinghuangia soli]